MASDTFVPSESLATESAHCVAKKRRPFALAAKRAMDIVGAIAFLAVAWPLFPIIAILVKLDSRGPVLYRRQVIGFRGKPFMALKFRSMVTDAHELLEKDPELLKQYQENLKITNDSRITRVGNFLRKTSLDELPQMFNVLMGEMSLVGPRMLGDIELAKFGSYQQKVLSVKPGIAGLWVASGRHTVSFERRMELELEYVDRWSILFDIKLLLMSFYLTLRMVGAQ